MSEQSVSNCFRRVTEKEIPQNYIIRLEQVCHWTFFLEISL
ncbi:unnamed protein product [Larinioides sclopetarius]|uniref:Uncharacterized protein n=1 Tax=Larinioides sclopetarius TaxID=280406 RepID=A0AAV1ZQQ2_9ARAC